VISYGGLTSVASSQEGRKRFGPTNNHRWGMRQPHGGTLDSSQRPNVRTRIYGKEKTPLTKDAGPTQSRKKERGKKAVLRRITNERKERKIQSKKKTEKPGKSTKGDPEKKKKKKKQKKTKKTQPTHKKKSQKKKKKNKKPKIRSGGSGSVLEKQSRPGQTSDWGDRGKSRCLLLAQPVHSSLKSGRR